MHTDLHIRMAREAVRHAHEDAVAPAAAGRYRSRARFTRTARFPAASAARTHTR
jgi:hypothetical protein